VLPSPDRETENLGPDVAVAGVDRRRADEIRVAIPTHHRGVAVAGQRDGPTLSGSSSHVISDQLAALLDPAIAAAGKDPRRADATEVPRGRGEGGKGPRSGKAQHKRAAEKPAAAGTLGDFAKDRKPWTPPKQILAPEASAGLRDRFLAELGSLASEDEATGWAQGALGGATGRTRAVPGTCTPMTSWQQLQANRLNALKSTGPRTEEGKSISRRNVGTGSPQRL
jgi:hypothetical protein